MVTGHKDMGIMGIKGWKHKAQERDECEKKNCREGQGSQMALDSVKKK